MFTRTSYSLEISTVQRCMGECWASSWRYIRVCIADPRRIVVGCVTYTRCVPSQRRRNIVPRFWCQAAAEQLCHAYAYLCECPYKYVCAFRHGEKLDWKIQKLRVHIYLRNVHTFVTNLNKKLIFYNLLK